MGMAKTWVLDTETKGTGAQMVPIEKVEQGRSEPARAVILPREKAPRPVEPRERKPPRFKVVDVMTRRVLAEDADTRAAVEALRGVRSAVDVSIYVWDEDAEAWKSLGMADRKRLLSFSSR